MLPNFAVEVLRRQKKHQAGRRLLAGSMWNPLDLVFDWGEGSPFHPDVFTRAFRRISREAGTGELRVHDIRHAYASLLLSKGVHPKVASEALGHHSVAFTLDAYSHVVPSMQEAAAQAIQEALG